MSDSILPSDSVLPVLSTDAQKARSVFEKNISQQQIGTLVRSVFDRAYDTARTNNYMLCQLSKTQKTALGTEIEIAIQKLGQITRGSLLDYSLGGIEVDMKCSVADGKPGKSWMIPEEALGHVVILFTAWETTTGSYYKIGWFDVPAEASGLGSPNKDRKRSILRKTLDTKVLWTVPQYRIPGNFLLSCLPGDRDTILAQPAGEARVLEALKIAGKGGGIIDNYTLSLFDVPDPLTRIPTLHNKLGQLGMTVDYDRTTNSWNIGSK